jgi:1-acyl-sn-glycerol-3-phosphate acyltransferase
VLGLEHLPKHRKDPPVVMVANHQSGADIWALYLTGAQFRWLSKQEVFNLPLIGSAMRWAGYVPIHRGDRQSHSRALKQSGEWLDKGISMVFFPEGTRSEDGRLKPFKAGAFKLAIEHKVGVQPIIIKGTRDMMQKKSLMPAPAELEVEVLPVIFPTENETSEDFAQRVHVVFGQHLPVALSRGITTESDLLLDSRLQVN